MSRFITITILLAVLTACEQQSGEKGTTTKAGGETPIQTAAKTPSHEQSKKTGTLWIRGSAQIGVQNSTWGDITITSVELAHPEKKTKTYGIRINIKEKGLSRGERSAYIDYGEIDALLEGIDYVSKVDKSVTKLDEFRATYTTSNDGLTIATYNYPHRRDQIEVAVSVGGNIGGVTIFLKQLAELQHLRNLIVEAKERLDSIKLETSKQEPKGR